MSKALKKEADTLIRAIKDNDEAEVRAILKDADDEVKLLNARGQQGHTPLWRAVKEGNRELVEMFVDKGADPTITDKFNGQGNCLHAAAEFGHPDLVRYFLDLDFDVDTRRDDGDETPLWLACSKGNLTCAKILVEEGANVHAINDEGVNCYDAAREHTYLPVLALLRENGYDPGDEPFIEEEDPGPRIGDIARHKSFGDGVIVSKIGFGDHLKFEVEFENHGTKKMLARFVDVLGPPQDQDDIGNKNEEAASS